MKKLHFILLGFTAIFFSCTEITEEEMVTKEAPIRWAPHSCNYYDSAGSYVGNGSKCKYDPSTGGCKWPTPCKLRSTPFANYANENVPGLDSDNWGSEILLKGSDIQTSYNILLMLWQEDPYNHYHPDSIPR